MSDLPVPLVPVEVDLRDFAFMPLDVLRLRDSELACVGDAEVFRCAVLSWCVSWHQVPAASLPDDDALLARLLGFGRDVKGWKRVREAGGMRGWTLCDDGRLYHPVVAEKARDAWAAKVAQRQRTEAARRAREEARQKQLQQQSQPLSQTPEKSVTETVTESKGQGQGQGIKDNTVTACPESVAKPRSRSGPAARWNGETVAMLPVTAHAEPEIPITREFVDEMQQAYPLVDVEATLSEIRAWCLANPARRKTATGVHRFVQSWLSREQNRG